MMLMKLLLLVNLYSKAELSFGLHCSAFNTWMESKLEQNHNKGQFALNLNFQLEFRARKRRINKAEVSKFH